MPNDRRRFGPTILPAPISYTLTSGADPLELAVILDELASRTKRPEWHQAAAGIRHVPDRRCRCGADLSGRRRDTVFCSAACRQEGYRKREAGEDAVLAVIRGNRVEVSEDLVERGLLAFDKCEDRDAVEDALLRQIFSTIRIRNDV